MRFSSGSVDGVAAAFAIVDGRAVNVTALDFSLGIGILSNPAVAEEDLRRAEIT